MKKIFFGLLFLSVLAAGCTQKTATNNKQADNAQQQQSQEKDFAKIETCTAQAGGKDPRYSNDSVSGNVKTYTNNRYGYSFDYPKSWYVQNTYAEDDFTARGAERFCMGGDVYVANYNKQFEFPDTPSDYDVLTMYVYKVDPATNLQGYVNATTANYTSVKTEVLTIGGTKALKVTAVAPDNTGVPTTYTWYVIKSPRNPTQLFAIMPSKNADVNNSVLTSLKFK